MNRAAAFGLVLAGFGVGLWAGVATAQALEPHRGHPSLFAEYAPAEDSCPSDGKPGVRLVAYERGVCTFEITP